jgi:hypothetical protein
MCDFRRVADSHEQHHGWEDVSKRAFACNPQNVIRDSTGGSSPQGKSFADARQIAWNLVKSGECERVLVVASAPLTGGANGGITDSTDP